MGFALHVQSGCLRVVPKANRPALVRHAGQRDSLADKQVAREQTLVALLPVRGTLRLLLHQLLQLLDQTLVPLLVVRPIGEHDVALPVQGHPVVGFGQVLGGEPEVQRVFAHPV